MCVPARENHTKAQPSGSHVCDAKIGYCHVAEEFDTSSICETH